MTAHDELARLVERLDYAMYVVTAAADGERSGCLVGFVTQASIDPLRFLVCLSDKNRTYRVASRASTLVVHLLAEDAGDVAELFGGETGDEVDKFARIAWSEGPESTPILDRCDTWFAGRVLDRIPVGDHVAFLLEPFDARTAEGEGLFPFHRARRIDAGHEP